MEQAQQIKVIQPNTITGLIYENGISSVQLKAINEIIRLSQKNMTSTIDIAKNISIKSYRISAEKCVGGRNKAYFEEQVRELVGKKVVYTDIDPNTGKARRIETVPFTTFAKVEGTSYVDIVINSDFIPILHCWQHGYTLYDSNVVETLKSKYAIRLYELMCKNRDRNIIWINIAYLKEILSMRVENKEVYRIVKSAIEEINKSDSQIKCVGCKIFSTQGKKEGESRKGKKAAYDTIEFTIENNESKISSISKKTEEMINCLKDSFTSELNIGPVQQESLIDVLIGKNSVEKFSNKYFIIRNKFISFGKVTTNSEIMQFRNTVRKMTKEDFGLNI